MKKALLFVELMKSYYPDKRIILTGHSMGAAFSSYCGIKNDFDVINFNGMGLTRRLVKKLSHEKNECHILHINSRHDWLSQFVQKLFLVQVGERVLLTRFGGHALAYRSETGDNIFLCNEMLNENHEGKHTV